MQLKNVLLFSTIHATCLALLLSLSVPHAAHAGPGMGGDLKGESQNNGSNNSSNTPETFNLPSFSASEFLTQTRKQIGFNPLLAVNTNRGSFETEIPLKLPPSLSGFRDLSLKYNSHNPHNLGLGIGWTWNLPLITAPKSQSGKTEWLTQGLIGSSELVPTQEPTSNLMPLVGKILSRAIGSSANVQSANSYRPAVDEQAILFLKVQMPQKCFIVSLAPNGERWVFDDKGLPIAFLNRNLQGLSFVWDQGLLTQISTLENTWKMSVQYTDGEQNYPQLFAGVWSRMPLGLSSIEFSSLSRKIFFENKNGLLSKAWIDGGLLPLFQGTYKPNQNIVTTKSTSNGLSIDDKREAYQSTRTDAIEITDKNDDVVYVDLNGDGRSDRVTIGYSQAASDFKNFLRNEHGGCGSIKDDVDNFSNNYVVPIKVEIAVANSPDEKSTFVEDKSFSIQDLLKSNGLKLLRFYVSCDNNQANPTILTQGILQFIDLNRDGLKDLIYVPYEPAFQDQKSLFAKQALFALGKGEKPAINPFDQGGKPVTIFLQSYDTDALRKHGVDLEKTSLPETTVNALTGYSIWTAVTNTGINMNQESQILELNGTLAILTGRSLYFAGNLRSSDPTEHSQVMAIDPMSLVSKETSLLQDTTHNLSLIQVSSESFLRLANTRFTRSNALTSDLEIFENGNTIDIQSGSHPMMTSLQSDFGGEIQISYIFKNGMWIVSQILKDPKNQPATIQSFAYKTPMIDAHRGTFIGFSETIESRSMLDAAFSAAVKTRNHYRQFSKDMSPAVSLYQSRARFNGRLLKEQEWEDGQSVFKETVSSDLVLKHLDANADRVWPLEIFNDSRWYQGNEITQRHTRTLNVISWASPNQMDLMPAEFIVREEGKGFHSIHNDDLIESVRSEHSYHHFSGDLYLLNLDKVQVFGNNDVSIKPVQTFLYDNQDLMIKQACSAQRCDLYDYDNLGRMQFHQTPLGAVTKFGYTGSSPLVATLSDERGTFQVSHDMASGRVSQLQTPKGMTYIWNYSPDEILQSFQKSSSQGSIELYSMKLDSKNKVLNTINLGKPATQLTDGFGRIVETQSWTAGQQASSGRQTLADGDLVISQEQPHFLNTPSSGLLYSNEINGKGEISKTKYANGDVIVQNDNGACKSTLKNNWLSEIICRGAAGNIISQTIGDEQVLIDSTAEGRIDGIPSLGLTFAHNDYQEVISNQADNPPIFWNKETRTISELGDRETGPEGLTVQRDSYGRDIQTSRDSLKDIDIFEKMTYSQGLLSAQTITNAKGNPVITSQFLYDSEDRPTITTISGAMGTLKNTSSYDDMRHVISQSAEFTLKTGEKSSTQINYIYDKGDLTSISSIVDSVEKDAYGNLTKIHYTNGATLKRTFEPTTHRLVGIEMISADGTSLLRETLQIQNFKVVSRSETSVLFSKTESFDYDSNNYQLLTDSQLAGSNPTLPHRNGKGQVTQDSNLSFSYRDGNLISWSTNNTADSSSLEMNFYYNHQGSILAACEGPGLRFGAKDCINKINGDEFIVHGSPVTLIRFEGQPVAIKTNESIYPVVIDHLGSLKYVLSADGKYLLIHRHFDTWGRKSIIQSEVSKSTENSELEQKIPWSYAGLIEIGSGNNLYWSESRVYNAAIQEWMTADPIVRWDARNLAEQPGNFFPYRYAGNDPLTSIDPSGKNIWLLLDQEGAGGHGHAAIVVGNKRDGYDLYSQGTVGGSTLGILSGSTKEGIGHLHADTPSEVVAKSHAIDTVQIYDKAIEFETSQIQDSEVKRNANQRMNDDQNYSPITNNCADFARERLDDAGFSTERKMMPNDYYKGVKEKYPMNKESIISPEGNFQ